MECILTQNAIFPWKYSFSFMLIKKGQSDIGKFAVLFYQKKIYLKYWYCIIVIPIESSEQIESE